MSLVKYTAFIVILISNISQIASAGTGNGSVLILKGVVTASLGEVNRTLIKGAEVFNGDIISTAPKSFVVIRMLDNTKLTLRPDTTIVIGEFNLEKGKEEGCVNLIKGGLRTVTGLIGKRKPEAFILDTPVASIGIRGTDFITRICEGELCQLDQDQYIEERFGDDPNVAEVINEELPEGAYAQCVTGAIVMTQCADQMESFELGKCRQTQKTSCYQVDLNADQAGYIGVQKIETQNDFGILPTVPKFMNKDPYFKLSEMEDTELELIEFFSEDGSKNQQCTF